ncbi:MAG: hypothetical protein PHF18_10515 [Methanosarcina sp.]|uniref:hypothetical protein n=1 Tax=Methanosarcina sp. TaxID=2213 RepID=UPI002624E679|nr:hypothetical protein [Methanosarcina sp.]MDD3247260.1 hypothetical protein [Methanosarcina sp.]MDD4250167.1 hypothetical protein [Methanosarcina sp.]
MEQETKIPPFQLLLESEEAEELSEYWQKQCCTLYNAINRNIMEGSIEPLTCKAAEGERAGIITVFNILSASGLSIKSVGHVFDVVKVWLDFRPKAKVVMKFPNGNEIEISGVTGFSKSEVLGLFEKSLQASKI